LIGLRQFFEPNCCTTWLPGRVPRLRQTFNPKPIEQRVGFRQAKENSLLVDHCPEFLERVDFSPSKLSLKSGRQASELVIGQEQPPIAPCASMQRFQ